MKKTNHLVYKTKSLVKIIFALAVFGVLFSGYLTYQELFSSGGLTCPSPGAPGTVFGYPACVYGFFMYLAIAILSGIAAFGKSR